MVFHVAGACAPSQHRRVVMCSSAIPVMKQGLHQGLQIVCLAVSHQASRSGSALAVIIWLTGTQPEFRARVLS
jgi:hypothetical protein